MVRRRVGALLVVALQCIVATILVPCEPNHGADTANGYSGEEHGTVLASNSDYSDSKASQQPAKASDESPCWYAPLKRPEWWLVIVAFLTFGFIGWQALETRNAAQASKLGAEAAIQNIALVINKERARLRVEPLEPYISISAREYSMTYAVLFEGYTPAFIRDTGVVATVCTTKEPPPDELVSSIFLPPVISAVTKMQDQGAILSGKVKDQRDFDNGRLFIHFWGFIKYRDVFDKDRETVFRYIWNSAGIPGLSGEWQKYGDNHDT